MPARVQSAVAAGSPAAACALSAGPVGNPAAAASRARAQPEATASRQPRPPQVQAGPSGSTSTCPASPRHPYAVSISRPSATAAALTPVPSATTSSRATPRPAPSRCSATAAAARSGTTTTCSAPSRRRHEVGQRPSGQVGQVGAVSQPPAVLDEGGHGDHDDARPPTGLRAERLADRAGQRLEQLLDGGRLARPSGGRPGPAPSRWRAPPAATTRRGRRRRSRSEHPLPSQSKEKVRRGASSICSSSEWRTPTSSPSPMANRVPRCPRPRASRGVPRR